MLTARLLAFIGGGMVLVGSFGRLLIDDKISVQQGKPLPQSSETDRPTITGTLLISPYDTQGDIFDLLAATKYTLKMRFYQITDKETHQLLRNLSQLGVDVDLIVENSTYGNNTKDFEKLQTALRGKSIEIRTDEHLGTNFMHAKAMLIDDEKFMISSANLTYPSFRNNREYRFISSHSGVAQSLVTIFGKDWIGEAILSGDIAEHLLVCPVNCRSKIEQALAGATTSIDIEAQYIEDRSIVGLLENKSEHLEVRLVVGEYQSDGRLENLSTGAKIFDDLYLHAKNILIDDTVLIMGSMNLSTNALDNNREFGIIIDDPRLIKQFKGQFERDWEKGRSLKGG